MQTLHSVNGGAVSTRQCGRQPYDADKVTRQLVPVYDALEALHSAALDVKYARMPKDLPPTVQAQVNELQRTAERWKNEINAAVEALEQSEVRAELLANGVDPDDENAVDRFFQRKSAART